MTFEALLPWLLVTGGILCLGLGGSWLVDGASRIALKLGIAPMVVGLTVVGFGTSMPEFAVSVMAALQGSGGLSLGNAVGSNIMNLLLVLGVAAVLVPIHVIGSRRLLYRDLAFGLAPAVVLMVFARTGSISQPTALLLLAIFVVFIVTAVSQARGHNSEPTVVTGTLTRHFALTFVGIAVLIGGSEMLVIGGVDLARRFGVSEALVGLTVVAFGTSLPELATSVVAVLKGQSEIGVGNVLGSNVFNLGLVLGTAALLKPLELPPELVVRQVLPALAFSILLIPLALTRQRVTRWEGMLLLLGYLGFFIWTV